MRYELKRADLRLFDRRKALCSCNDAGGHITAVVLTSITLSSSRADSCYGPPSAIRYSFTVKNTRTVWQLE